MGLVSLLDRGKTYASLFSIIFVLLIKAASPKLQKIRHLFNEYAARLIIVVNNPFVGTD